jgi:hypothetical protein
MKEEARKEVERSEEELRKIDAGRRTRFYDDGVAQRRVPQRHVEDDGPIERRIDVPPEA